MSSPTTDLQLPEKRAPLFFTKSISRRQLAQGFALHMRCTCDLDNWEPERETGHSCVCNIHRAALSLHLGDQIPESVRRAIEAAAGGSNGE